uniref:Uncharacterized protein n=1 Tax=Strigamia maritima TaxID=126957 RepID=T1IYN6_STRMM
MALATLSVAHIMGCRSVGCFSPTEGSKAMKKGLRRGSANGLGSFRRRNSQAPTNISMYEKCRLMVHLLMYLLVLQWIMILPVILIVLLYSFFCRTINYFIQSIVSIFSKPKLFCSKQTVLINGCSQMKKINIRIATSLPSSITDCSVALHVARLLNASGHKVIACDFGLNWFNPTKFSNAIDAYYTVPDPRRGVQEYIRELCLIAQKEKVDVFIPVSRVEDMRFDLLTKSKLERQGCRVFLLHRYSGNSLIPVNNNNVETDHVNYNRMNSSSSSDDFGALTRRSNSLSSEESLNCDEDDLLTDLSGFHSFLFSMEKFTSTSLICDGKCIAISTSSNNPDSNFKLTKDINEQILKMNDGVLKQLGSENQSGGLTFNLVISEEGRAFPLSCYPSIGAPFLNFKKEPEFINCLVQGKPCETSRPLQSVVEPMHYSIYPELLSCLRQPSMSQMKHFCRQLRRSSEAFFDSGDPLPFFAHYHLHLPFIIGCQLLRKKTWTEVDCVNGKLVENNFD